MASSEGSMVVATITSSTPLTRCARSMTCPSTVWFPRFRSTFPGSLLDPIRAWMMATTFIAEPCAKYLRQGSGPHPKDAHAAAGISLSRSSAPTVENLQGGSPAIGSRAAYALGCSAHLRRSRSREDTRILAIWTTSFGRGPGKWDIGGTRIGSTDSAREEAMEDQRAGRHSVLRAPVFSLQILRFFPSDWPQAPPGCPSSDSCSLNRSAHRTMVRALCCSSDPDPGRHRGSEAGAFDWP